MLTTTTKKKKHRILSVCCLRSVVEDRLLPLCRSTDSLAQVKLERERWSERERETDRGRGEEAGWGVCVGGYNGSIIRFGL